MERFDFSLGTNGGQYRHTDGGWVRYTDALRAENRAEALEDAILEFKQGRIDREELFERGEKSALKIGTGAEAKGRAA